MYFLLTFKRFEITSKLKFISVKERKNKLGLNEEFFKNVLWSRERTCVTRDRITGRELTKKQLIKKKNYYYERYYAKLRKMTLVRNRIISIVGEKYRK